MRRGKPVSIPDERHNAYGPKRRPNHLLQHHKMTSAEGPFVIKLASYELLTCDSRSGC